MRMTTTTSALLTVNHLQTNILVPPLIAPPSSSSPHSPAPPSFPTGLSVSINWSLARQRRLHYYCILYLSRSRHMRHTQRRGGSAEHLPTLAASSQAVVVPAKIHSHFTCLTRPLTSPRPRRLHLSSHPGPSRAGHKRACVHLHYCICVCLRRRLR